MPEPTTDQPHGHSRVERIITSYEVATSPNILLPGLEHLEYDELFDRYKESRFGLHHAKQPPRFSQHYTYDYSQTLIDLGDDVHPVKHMKHTHDTITQPFVIAQFYELTPREVVILRLGTLIHDMGECTFQELAQLGEPRGDTSYGEKVDGEEAIEKKFRDYIIKELWPEIPVDLLDEMNKMVMNDNSRLGRMFNSIERLGYLESGLKAAKVAKKALDEKQIEEGYKQPYEKTRLLQLSLMGLWVANTRSELKNKPFGQHYTTLNSYRDDYPFIDKRMAEIDEELEADGRKNLSRLAIISADLQALPYIESFDPEKYHDIAA